MLSIFSGKRTGLLLLGILNACTSSTEKGPLAFYPRTDTFLAELTTWNFDGRIAVKMREEAWQAHLFWEHDAQQDRLRISGPLNQGVVSVILQKGVIYMKEDSEIQQSVISESSLYERLGFTIPISYLRYWMLGIPHPMEPYVPFLEQGTCLRRFSQADWNICIERFETIDTLRLPNKMRIDHMDVSLKIVNEEWSFVHTAP